MRVLAVLLMFLTSGCMKPATANDIEPAKCFAASELALMVHGETQPNIEPVKPKPTACQCGGSRYVNDRSSGKLKRIACQCGQSCKCIGCANEVAAVVEKRPAVIFWSAKWCAPCKAILKEIDACKNELPFTVEIKDDDDKRPEWVTSLPTLHWPVEAKWVAFAPSKEEPWPGIDGFVRMWRKSFPTYAAPVSQQAYGLSSGAKLPIRATVQQVKQLLSDKGLRLPYGMSVNAPTHGLIASVSQAGQDVVIEFDESTLPHVSFNGRVRKAVIGETRGNVLIDGLPDIQFEVTQ